ncbi:MAG: diguanylate cyclase [Desulfobulbus sp.]
MVHGKNDGKVPIFGKILKIFLFLFFVASASLNGILFVLYQTEKQYYLDNLQKIERFSVSAQKFAVRDDFSAIFADILFLSQQNELVHFLRTGDPALVRNIAEEYRLFSLNHGLYDQIRYIDQEGMEIVRVNYNAGHPIVVGPKDLQSKKERYYFQDCFKLNRDEIFLSPFDLNMEHGKIEEPINPMVRVGTPVFSSDGQKRGIVLVNYLGKRLIEKIRSASQVARRQTMVLNTDGYWLVSPHAEQEWGFMYHDETKRLGALDAQAWEMISRKKEGQFQTDKGMYTFESVYPAASREYCHSSKGRADSSTPSAEQFSASQYHWYLVSFFPTQSLEEAERSLAFKYLLIGGGGLFLVITGAWAVAYAAAKHRVYQKNLKKLALYDSLTTLPNRILFFDRLTMMAEHSLRYKSQFALLYLDLDGFKQVNDSLGHDAGDTLLTTVGSELIGACRKSDTVARLGGDEFAILFSNLKSVDELHDFAQRIVNTLSQELNLPVGQVRIGVSIGIARYPEDSDNIETLLSMADKAMYCSKKKGKNTYTFAQS